MGMAAGSIFGGMGGPILIEKVGVWNTFLVFGLVFGTIITACGLILKNPPEGYTPPVITNSVNKIKESTNKMKNNIVSNDYSAKEMMSTLSFYLIWLVFLIGTGGCLMVISQASPFGQNIVELTPVITGSVIMV